MEHAKICQSCTMPIDDPKERGTEKEGSKSELYCQYCYQNGAFTDPGLTLQQMKNTVVAEMKKQQLPDNLIERCLQLLPGLQRWRQ